MAERKKVAYALRSRKIEVPATPLATPQNPPRKAEDGDQEENARARPIRPEGWEHVSLGYHCWMWTSPEVTHKKSDYNSQRIPPGEERFAAPNAKVTGAEVVKVTIDGSNKGTLSVRAGSQLQWKPSAPHTEKLNEKNFFDLRVGFKFQLIPNDSDLAAVIAADPNIVAIIKIREILGMFFCNQDAGTAEPEIDEILQDPNQDAAIDLSVPRREERRREREQAGAFAPRPFKTLGYPGRSQPHFNRPKLHNSANFFVPNTGHNNQRAWNSASHSMGEPSTRGLGNPPGTGSNNQRTWYPALHWMGEPSTRGWGNLPGAASNNQRTWYNDSHSMGQPSTRGRGNPPGTGSSNQRTWYSAPIGWVSLPLEDGVIHLVQEVTISALGPATPIQWASLPLEDGVTRLVRAPGAHFAQGRIAG